MKSKKMMVSMLSMSMVLGAAALPAYASTTIQTTQKEEMMPYAIGEIDANSLTDVDGFSTYFELSKGGGKYINFWVKNTGRNSIAITINDKGERVIEPGKSGHISVKAGALTKGYVFKAEGTPNGGRISLDYRIAQRDSQ